MWWFRAEAWAPRGFSPHCHFSRAHPQQSPESAAFEGAPAVCLFILYVFSLFTFQVEYRLLYKTEKYKRAATLSPFFVR